MTISKLIQDGYKPANIIILHDSSTIIKTPSTKTDSAWWKEDYTMGKTITLDGQELEYLAKMMGIETSPLEFSGKNGKRFRQALSSMPIRIGQLEIDQQDSIQQVENLFAKAEHGIIHIAACFEGQKFVFSTHGGSFDISWITTIEEVTAK